eukprot:COSAG04_NODE_21354_length_375_cov_0.750000_1_plen_58_part_01
MRTVEAADGAAPAVIHLQEGVDAPTPRDIPEVEEVPCTHERRLLLQVDAVMTFRAMEP